VAAESHDGRRHGADPATDAVGPVTSRIVSVFVRVWRTVWDGDTPQIDHHRPDDGSVARERSGTGNGRGPLIVVGDRCRRQSRNGDVRVIVPKNER
jgi:hypothetical protein